MFSVQKKLISVTGKASLGWFLGCGYVQDTFTVKVEKWCVMRDGDSKPMCICRGKKNAEEVASLMNGSLHG